MLSDEQQASMRATNAKLFDPNAAQAVEVVIWRNVVSPDGEGGQISDWQVVTTTHAIRERATRQQIQAVVADRVTNATYWAVELPVTTPITDKDRIVEAARTFEVLAALDDSFGIDLIVVCLEVT